MAYRQENGQSAASGDGPEKLISSRLVRPPPMTAAIPATGEL